MADVFVSYSRKDAPRVKMLVRAIEAHGLSVWWDRSLEQGADFGQIIANEIAAAKACIVCWSADAVESRWVRSEAMEADALNKYVGALIAPGRAPPPYNVLNNANLPAWDGAADDMQILNLLTEVGRLTERPDISERAAGMKQSLDDQAARERAAVEAQRAEDARAAADAKSKAEQARVQSLAADTAALYLLQVECSRFKDEESFLAAGRSWRTPDGARRTWFCWLWALAVTGAFAIYVNTTTSGVIAFIVLLLGAPIVLLGALILSIPLNRMIFNEHKSWVQSPFDEADYRTKRLIAKGHKDEIAKFKASDTFQRLQRDFEKRPDLQAMFADRPSMWRG